MKGAAWRAAALLLLAAAFFALTEARALAPAGNARLGSEGNMNLTEPEAKRYEIVAVKETEEVARAERILRYIQDRYPDTPAEEVPAIVAVPWEEGLPEYEPLPFHEPTSVAFVAYGAGHNIVPFDASCRCDVAGRTIRLMNALKKQRDDDLAVLLLRSALYRYYEDHDMTLPDDLESLTDSFPANYLSSIPVPRAGEAEYRPERFDPLHPWTSLSDVLSIPGSAHTPNFAEPIRLKLYTSSFQLAVESGGTALRTFEAAIGSPAEPTPAGSYQVELRVNEPLHENGLFGTRALAFAKGELAIHGTNGGAFVGEPISRGCIRMRGSDIEELFAMTPLGTTIDIVNEPSPHPFRESADRFALPARADETSKIRYFWRG